MSQIAIYKSKSGSIALDVNIEDETLWLSQQQMAELFGTQRQAITKHLQNIFKTQELDEKAVSSKKEQTASDGKKYKVKFYALDAVISVGYRVNSSKATEFRIWANQVLKEYVLKGYSLNHKKLAQKGLEEVEHTLGLIKKTLTQCDGTSEIGLATVDLIIKYSKTWKWLMGYDANSLKTEGRSTFDTEPLAYEKVLKIVMSFKSQLMEKKEATEIFGKERDNGLEGLLGSVFQTYGGDLLYSTIEERGAHLLYFIIKDHPFIDGNKRIGCLIFLTYLEMNKIPIQFNESGLAALALLVAESYPSQKMLMIKLIVNFING